MNVSFISNKNTVDIASILFLFCVELQNVLSYWQVFELRDFNEMHTASNEISRSFDGFLQ